MKWSFKHCAVIVAHPDDETLWAGGTILLHPDANWTIITLCRKSDPDRADKFYKALAEFGAKGSMGDLNDSTEQTSLDIQEVENVILELLPSDRFDLIITHGLWGEYTRHRRHEETSKAVIALWDRQMLFANELWRFAYQDAAGKSLPQAVRGADISSRLPEGIWKKKYDIITRVYGFAPESFEARTTPREEAFWRFRKSQDIKG